MTYPEVAYIGKHKGIHIKDGIYRVEVPFRIDVDLWADDRQYEDYAVVGTNYSDDYSKCDVIYFTTYNYGELGDLKIRLCRENKSNYGYVQNAWNSNQPDMLGGLTFEI